MNASPTRVLAVAVHSVFASQKAPGFWAVEWGFLLLTGFVRRLIWVMRHATPLQLSRLWSLRYCSHKLDGWMSVGILLYSNVPTASCFHFALPVANFYRQYPRNLRLIIFLWIYFMIAYFKKIRTMEMRVTRSTEWLNFGLITDPVLFLIFIPLWYIHSFI